MPECGLSAARQGISLQIESVILAVLVNEKKIRIYNTGFRFRLHVHPQSIPNGSDFMLSKMKQ